MIARCRGVLVIALAAVLIVPSALEAQRRGPPRSQDRERLEQRMRAQMGRIMRERLGLSEEQADRLGEIVAEFDAERRQLFREEQATRRRVEALMIEGSGDDEEAARLLETMIDLRHREAELFTAEQAALGEVLTPIQVLQYQSFREQLGRRIRQLRGDRGSGENGRRRGGREGGNWGDGGLARSPIPG